MNQTARISLQSSINVKEQCCHPEPKNQTDAPISRRARLIQTLRCRRLSSASHRLSGAFPVQSRVAAAPSGVSQLRLSAAGEGAFTDTPADPQPKNSEKRRIPERKITNTIKTKPYTKSKSETLTRLPPLPRAANHPGHRQTGTRSTYPQTQPHYPQTQ